MSNDRDDENGFEYGQWVESKLNTNVFGIVVGSDCLGLKYDVQLSPSLVVAQFYGATLRPMEGEDDEVPPRDEDTADNVIDFTKARELRAATETRGVA